MILSIEFRWHLEENSTYCTGLEILPKCFASVTCVILLAFPLIAHIFCEIVQKNDRLTLTPVMNDFRYMAWKFHCCHSITCVISLAFPPIVHIFCYIVRVNRSKSERETVTPLMFLNDFQPWIVVPSILVHVLTLVLPLLPPVPGLVVVDEGQGVRAAGGGGRVAGEGEAVATHLRSKDSVWIRHHVEENFT